MLLLESNNNGSEGKAVGITQVQRSRDLQCPLDLVKQYIPHTTVQVNTNQICQKTF